MIQTFTLPRNLGIERPNTQQIYLFVSFQKIYLFLSFQKKIFVGTISKKNFFSADDSEDSAGNMSSTGGPLKQRTN